VNLGGITCDTKIDDIEIDEEMKPTTRELAKRLRVHTHVPQQDEGSGPKLITDLILDIAKR
jgi:hypothetical protein